MGDPKDATGSKTDTHRGPIGINFRKTSSPINTVWGRIHRKRMPVPRKIASPLGAAQRQQLTGSMPFRYLSLQRRKLRLVFWGDTPDS